MFASGLWVLSYVLFRYEWCSMFCHFVFNQGSLNLVCLASVERWAGFAARWFNQFNLSFLLDKQHLCTTRTRHHPHVVWHTMRIYFCPWSMDLWVCHGWLMLQGNSLRLLPVRAQDGQCCQVELSSDQWVAVTGSPLCLRLGENCSTWPVSMRIA